MEEKQLGRELLILSNKFKRLLDKRHSKNGLFVGQARILNFLYFRKSETVYQKDIENAFQIRGGSVTGMIDSLVKEDYIKRVESKTDKRKREIVLTKLGESIAIKSQESIKEVETSLSSVLTLEEREVFNNLLMKIDKWIDEEENNEKTI